MKRWVRNALAGAMLALVLCAGFAPRTARAQTASAQSSSPGASAVGAQSSAKEQPTQDADDAYRMSPSVVAIGAKLGMSPERASNAFTIGNFLLLAMGVVWFAAKALPKLLHERSAAIQKNLADARTATEEARSRLSGVEERLSKLDGEIAAMRVHAEQDSAAAEQRIKAAVEAEKKRILEAAEQEIASATGHAQKHLQQYAAGLAIEQAAHKLSVSAETDRLLVQSFAQRLTGDDPKKGQN